MGTVSWNVFDFGATRGRVDSARSQLDAIDARRRKARNHLLYEVGHSYRALGSARAHLAAARTAEQKEAAAAHLLQLRYQQGLTTLDDLLKAQAGLDQARADLIDARLRTILTAGRLSLLTGHIPDLTPAAPTAAVANHH
jgi:Outer membrane protein